MCSDARRWRSRRPGRAGRRAESRSARRCSRGTASCSGAATTGASRTTIRPCTARPTRSATRAGGAPTADTVMVTTLSPCWYCCGLIRQFGIGAVVIGESRTFAGGHDWLREHGVEVIDSTPTSATSCCRASSPSTPRSGTRTSANDRRARASRSPWRPARRSTPAAMRLEGVPTTLVSGRSYTASLAATGAGRRSGTGGSWACSTASGAGTRRPAGLGLRAGVQRRADGHAVHGLRHLRGAGLHADPLGDGGGGATRARLVSRRRGAVEPRTIVLGCHGQAPAVLDLARVELGRRDRPRRG